MPLGSFPPGQTNTIETTITGGVLKFSGAIATGVAAVTSHLADAGGPGASAVAGLQNQAAQEYPTSQRTFRNLRVTKGLMSGEGADQNITVALLINGTPTALSVVVLAADPAGTQYADTVHVVTVPGGDTFDLRASAGGTETPIVTALSAAVDSEIPIDDVSEFDARSFALDRARELGVFTRVPTTFEDAFIAPPGTAPSQWLRHSGTGTVIQVADARGGVIRVSSAATANTVEAWELGQAAGNRPGLILDPGVAGSFWYILWIFNVPTAVDNHTTVTLSLIPVTGTANQALFGVDGVFESTTKLMAEEVLLNATLSTIDISPGTWHYLEAYQLGTANDIKFRFDGEAELTLTLTGSFGHSASLQMVAKNGATAAVRSLDTDHLVVLMDGNVSLG